MRSQGSKTLDSTLEMLRNDTESAPSAFRFAPGFSFAERPVAFATGLFNKPVLRQCLSCRGGFDRKQLIRITQDHKSKEYQIQPSRGIGVFGRSIYLCHSENCLNKLRKHKKYKDILDFAALEVIIKK